MYLIRTIALTADKREIVRERELETDRLTIGRASESDLHLVDLAVEQNHALIEPAGDQLRVSSAGTLGFTVNGKSTTEATIDPRQGAELGFGSYRLTLSQDGARDGDAPVKITVAQAASAEGASDTVRAFALASALPSKRAMAWGALATILIAFMAVPIWSHLTRDKITDPDIDRANISGDAVLMDASWSTGALSVAHHDLEDNCESCHVDAFVSVQDETCLACHTEIADHAQVSRQVTGMGPMSWGDDIQWAVAEAFGKEGPGTCATCHSEHEAAPRLTTVSQQFCSECHTELDEHLTDTKLENAGDFETSHPQFQAALYTGPGEDSLTRISLDENPSEYTGLKFPHGLHADTRGGVAQMASRIGAKGGYGEALVCADCHTLTDDKRTFTDVNMEEDCEACHSLAAPGGRQLSHGSVAQLRRELATFGRPTGRKPAPGRKRPGEFARGGLYFQNFGAPVRNYTAITRALAQGGVCGDCHLPTTTAGQPDVMPVRDQDRYFTGGYFDHTDHLEESCTTCHAADTSNASADLLMPDIAICRDCHVGEEPAGIQTALAWPHNPKYGPKAKLTPASATRPSVGGKKTDEVSSSCAMCHSYHPRGDKGLSYPDVPHSRDHEPAKGPKRAPDNGGDTDRIARLGRETG